MPVKFNSLFNILICAGLCFGAVESISPVYAQGANPQASNELKARQAHLLTILLKQPDNLDVSFEYAMISAQIGDYEAAIGTFERMLIYSPGLPRVQLELGVLYFRLGSTDAARSYFESAISGPEVPPEVQARVEEYLAAIGTNENPAKFRATVLAGARYQSNANAGPGDRSINLNGVNFLLNQTSTGQSDVNGFVAATLHGGYDLGTQGDLLEADLLLFGARYADLSKLDTGLAELTFGPSFNMRRFNVDNARLGFYGILSGVRLDTANYLGAMGLGSRFAWRLDPATTLSGKFEFRYRWYHDTVTYSTVSDRNGHFYKGGLTLTHQFSQSWAGRTLIFGDYEETAKAWEQSYEIGGGVGATYKFASPFEALPDRWSIDLEAGYIRRLYDSPDPLINKNDSQNDHEGWVRAALNVPLKNDFSIGLTGEFRRVYSNYDLATYSNASAMVSVAKNF